jgi:hypothetical protein
VQIGVAPGGDVVIDIPLDILTTYYKTFYSSPKTASNLLYFFGNFNDYKDISSGYLGRKVNKIVQDYGKP